VAPRSRGRPIEGAMVKAKLKAYEDYTPPGGTERRLRLAPGTASGYYGVIKNKGKWQGMGYDPNKQSRRRVSMRSRRMRPCRWRCSTPRYTYHVIGRCNYTVRNYM
jgi:hypothetical protein